jgi:mxaJ protein
LVAAVEKGDVDIAAVWGPIAGYAAKQSAVPLRLAAIDGGEHFAPLRFQFDIAMGVRRGDHELREKLDAVITDNRAEITTLLKSYGVPLLPMTDKAALHQEEKQDGQ